MGAKTGQDISTDCRAEFIEPFPTFVTIQRMLDLINLAQEEYVRRTKCLTGIKYSNTVAGQAVYPLPPDWLSSEKVFYNNFTTNSTGGTTDGWYPLQSITLEKLSQEHPNFLNGIPSGATQVPTHSYVVGQNLYLWPVPTVSANRNLYMFYSAKPIDLIALSDSLSVDDSLSPGIRAYVLWKIFAQDNEDQKGAAQQQLFEQEVTRGLAWKKRKLIDALPNLDIASPYARSYGNAQPGNTGWNPLSY